MPLARKQLHPGLGERVRHLRRRDGRSARLLSVQANISLNRLRDAEVHNLATTATLNAIARALGVSVDELTGRKAAP